MQVARDLIRDLVGILFPGGLLVIFSLWSFWAIIVPFSPSTSFNIFSTEYSFIVLLIISYIMGQMMRIKRLDNLEKICTAEYRKKKFSNLKQSQTEWDELVNKIEEEKKEFYLGNSNIDKLKTLYTEYTQNFWLWEEFPYAYHSTARRLSSQSEDYIKFFEKYDKQGIMKTKTFFHFCKSVIYEYSPSFKEEVLYQESLVRLFAGIYYVIKCGKVGL
jgi:hypothetical protein